MAASSKIFHLMDKYKGSAYEDVLGKAVQTYIYRGREKYGDSIARFRASPKVHKDPWTLRPGLQNVEHTSNASANG